MKGHQQLGFEIKDERIAYIAARHAKRILSDAYGKGVVRSNQESTNLRTYTKENDVTAAETFRTAQCMSFAGHEFCSLVEQANTAKEAPSQVQVWSINPKNSRQA